MLNLKLTFSSANCCIGGLLVAWIICGNTWVFFTLGIVLGSLYSYSIWSTEAKQLFEESTIGKALFGKTDSFSEDMSLFKFKRSDGSKDSPNFAKDLRSRGVSSLGFRNRNTLQNENVTLNALKRDETLENSRSSVGAATSFSVTPRRKFSDSGFSTAINRSDASPLSFITSPFSRLSTSGSGKVISPLPKVQRARSPVVSLGSSSFLGKVVAMRRYPTHQPQYDTVGILPAVRLHSPSRNVLSENNSMISPVTVKVAPPDVLKPPTPVIVHIARKPEANDIMTALKRKRNATEDEGIVEAHQLSQENKRRRQQQIDCTAPLTVDETPQEGAATSSGRIASKRPAVSELEKETEEEKAPKRVRTESGESGIFLDGAFCGTRNAIDISYSSSKRWIEKQMQKRTPSADDEKCSLAGPSQNSDEHSASRSGDKFSLDVDAQGKNIHKPHLGAGSLPPQSDRSTPIRLGQALRDLKDDDEPMAERGTAASNTPVPCSSGRSTPSLLNTGSELDDSFSKSNTPKKRLILLKKDGSSKRRLTPMHTDLANKLSKLPQLRYSLTVDDFEKDRRAERARVNQMMEEIEEAHKLHLEKKAKPLKQAETTLATSTVSEPIVSTKSITQSASLTTSTTVTSSGITTTPSLGGFKLPTSVSVESKESVAQNTIANTVPPSENNAAKQSTAKVVSSSSVGAPGGFMFGQTISSVPNTSQASKAASKSAVAASNIASLLPGSKLGSGVTTTFNTSLSATISSTPSMASSGPASSLSTPVQNTLGVLPVSAVSGFNQGSMQPSLSSAGTLPPPSASAIIQQTSTAGGFQFGLPVVSKDNNSATSGAPSGPFTFGSTLSDQKSSVAAPSVSTASPFGHHSHSAPSLSNLLSSAGPGFETTSRPAATFSSASSVQSHGSSSSLFSFGGENSTTNTSTASFSFGQAKAAAASDNKGGGTGMFQFGPSNSASSTLTFGQTSTTSSTTSNDTSKKITAFGKESASGGPNQNPTSGFQFGAQNATSSAITSNKSGFGFGQNSQSSPNIFGTATTSSANAFGSSSGSQASMFGAGVPAQPTSFNSGPATSNSNFSFGSGGTQNSFGSGSALGFGQAQTSGTQGGGVKPSFGGPANASSSGLPAPNFNFTAGNPASGFGSQQPAQSQTPSFGVGQATPNNNMASPNMASNMFSIGPGNAAPRRTTVRAQRRAVRRR